MSLKAFKANLWVDQRVCAYCGFRFRGKADATVDHVVPIVMGGKTEMSNLVLACQPCNNAKGDLSEYDFLSRFDELRGAGGSRTDARPRDLGA